MVSLKKESLDFSEEKKYLGQTQQEIKQSFIDKQDMPCISLLSLPYTDEYAVYMFDECHNCFYKNECIRIKDLVSEKGGEVLIELPRDSNGKPNLNYCYSPEIEKKSDYNGQNFYKIVDLLNKSGQDKVIVPLDIRRYGHEDYPLCFAVTVDNKNYLFDFVEISADSETYKYTNCKCLSSLHKVERIALEKFRKKTTSFSSYFKDGYEKERDFYSRVRKRLIERAERLMIKCHSIDPFLKNKTIGDSIEHQEKEYQNQLALLAKGQKNEILEGSMEQEENESTNKKVEEQQTKRLLKQLKMDCDAHDALLELFLFEEIIKRMFDENLYVVFGKEHLYQVIKAILEEMHDGDIQKIIDFADKISVENSWYSKRYIMEEAQKRLENGEVTITLTSIYNNLSSQGGTYQVKTIQDAEARFFDLDKYNLEGCEYTTIMGEEVCEVYKKVTSIKIELVEEIVETANEEAKPVKKEAIELVEEEDTELLNEIVETANEEAKPVKKEAIELVEEEDTELLNEIMETANEEAMPVKKEATELVEKEDKKILQSVKNWLVRNKNKFSKKKKKKKWCR